MITKRLVCGLIATLLLLSVRVQLHTGGYWQWARLKRLEESRPTLVRRLWLRSFERTVEEVPRPLLGLTVVWIRLGTIVLSSVFLLGGLVFALVAIDPDLA